MISKINEKLKSKLQGRWTGFEGWSQWRTTPRLTIIFTVRVISQQAAVLLRGPKTARLSGPPGRQLLQRRKPGSGVNAGVCLVGQKAWLHVGGAATLSPDESLNLNARASQQWSSAANCACGCWNWTCFLDAVSAAMSYFLPESTAWTLTGLSEQIVNPNPSFPRTMLTCRCRGNTPLAQPASHLHVQSSEPRPAAAGQRREAGKL